MNSFRKMAGTSGHAVAQVKDIALMEKNGELSKQQAKQFKDQILAEMKAGASHVGWHAAGQRASNASR